MPCFLVYSCSPVPRKNVPCNDEALPLQCETQKIKFKFP